VFGRITDAGLRYELGVFLGEQASRDDDALAYFNVAAVARPDGKQALRGLVRCYQQLGREAESARAMESLLALYDPGEPSAVDLRLILAGILAQAPATLGRALEHARIVLQARGDDPRAIQLMASLLERSRQPAEAADLLERLTARERDPDRLHDLFMQRAKLLAEVPGREAHALAAVEKAAEYGPGNRTTILLLIRLLERSGKVDRVATYLDPIRAAMLTSIGRGAVNPSDIRMLAEVAARPNPALAQMGRLLVYALEPSSAPPPDGHMRPASMTGVQTVLGTANLRQMVLSPGESADISDLLACSRVGDGPHVHRVHRPQPRRGRADAAEHRHPDAHRPAGAVEPPRRPRPAWPCAPARSTTPSPCSRRATTTSCASASTCGCAATTWPGAASRRSPWPATRSAAARSARSPPSSSTSSSPPPSRSPRCSTRSPPTPTPAASAT
jgi:tetratricopeptide (TPR) repeat protein